MGALKAASVCGISKRGEITRHVVRERRPPFSDFGPARRRDREIRRGRGNSFLAWLRATIEDEDANGAASPGDRRADDVVELGHAGVLDAVTRLIRIRDERLPGTSAEVGYRRAFGSC
jgi:hypothetical protein